MESIRITVGEKTTQAHVESMLALGPKGNLRGVKEADGSIVLYISPPKPGSTGFANFLAKFGLGGLHERRVLVAQAMRDIAFRTGQQQSEPAGEAKWLSNGKGGKALENELMAGIPTHTAGQEDITTETLAPAWGKADARTAFLQPYLAKQSAADAVAILSDIRRLASGVRASRMYVQRNRGVVAGAMQKERAATLEPRRGGPDALTATGRAPKAGATSKVAPEELDRQLRVRGKEVQIRKEDLSRVIRNSANADEYLKAFALELVEDEMERSGAGDVHSLSADALAQKVDEKYKALFRLGVSPSARRDDDFDAPAKKSER